MRAGQNPVDILCNLPAVAPAGSFIVTDPRGVHPLAYLGFGQALFYELNLWTGALQRLADIPAGLVFGAGTCAAYDSTNGRVWAVGPGAGAGDDSYTGYFSLATGAWVAADAGNTLDGLLGATWGTDASLFCFSTALSGAYPITNAAGIANLLLRGSGLNTCYQFGIGADTWVASAVPGVVSGAGTTLVPAWGHNPDRVYSTHGGGSTVVRYYGIAGNAWGNVTPVPTFVDAPNTGTSAVAHPDGRKILYRLNATGQILYYDPVTNALVPYARIYGPDGTATVGSKLCAYKQDGDTYLVALVHGSSQVQRIRIVE